MLYFDSANKLVDIDTIYTPVVDNFMWVLDLEQNDFTLAPITMLLEITTSSFEIIVDGLPIVLPTNWYVVIYDDEIGMMDVVQISELMGRNFKLFTYGLSDLMVTGIS